MLDNAEKYLADGRINIVAAPGSGKTVLGLELIRRIGEPCLIFSPTTAIREQWGERFRDMFLDRLEDYGDLFSSDLGELRLINSVTYQALFSALEKNAAGKTSEVNGNDEEAVDPEETKEEEEDCSGIDILKQIKEKGIGTLCLDEAHHLKNEWQRALERLIAIMPDNIKIISLTATPPYDSESNEWNRYLSMCGEVDEEIFVPELVAKDTLCPHQDYILFNYPTVSETAALNEYRKSAYDAVRKVGKLDFLTTIVDNLNNLTDYDRLFSSVEGYTSLLVLLDFYGFEPSKRLVKALVGKRGLPCFNMQFAERALRFITEGDILSEEEKNSVLAIMKQHGVYRKRKIELVLSERLKRSLISSVGKLESIRRIAESEYSALGKDLRMLILTDFIKKERISDIAGEKCFGDISVVSIFETVRRTGPALNIGVLSGSLIILPEGITPYGIRAASRSIPGTGYKALELSGSVSEAVRAIGKLFESGEIQILIGTKALLGEGWDAPCINSLIMASFIGSYVLSNQMRGRAIRIDRNVPDKTASIWHLVTVEPEYIFEENRIKKAKKFFKEDRESISSYDYSVLKRRFDSFMGPCYEGGGIESGIDRISLIKPPFDRGGIEEINEKMLSLSKRRVEMKKKWEGEVKNGAFTVTAWCDVNREKRVPVFGFYNIAMLAVLSVLEIFTVRHFFIWIARALIGQGQDNYVSLSGLLIFALLSAVIFLCGYRLGRKMILHLNPARSLRTLGISVFGTLSECGLISSSAKVDVCSVKSLGYMSISLRNASIHDQNLFNTAMSELLSPIENPRYILVKKSRSSKYNYFYSFACPSVIGRKKEYVQALADKLKKDTGTFVPVYTRNENGRSFILKCRNGSYITYNHRMTDKKYRVRRWE